jgi:hypothetical protein
MNFITRISPAAKILLIIFYLGFFVNHTAFSQANKGISADEVQNFIPRTSLVSIQPQDSFSVVIENQTSTPVECYPYTVFDKKGDAPIFIDENSFCRYLTTKNGVALSQEESIQRLAYIVKSTRFVHTQENPSICYNDAGWIEASGNKRFSTIGFPLAFSSNQCGEFRTFCASVLASCGIFKKESVLYLTVANHELLGLVMNGDTAVVDFDSGTQFLYTKSKNGHFLSAKDIQASPDIFFAQARHYEVPDPVDGLCSPGVCGQRLIEDTVYQNMFYEYAHSRSDIIQSLPVSGMWRIPKGVKISFGFKVPAVVIDTRIPGNKRKLDLTIRCLQGDCEEVPKGLLPTEDPEEIENIFKSGNFLIMSDRDSFDISKAGLFANHNLVTIEINSGANPIVLGKDFQLPMAIKTIKTSKALSIGDTVFPAGVSQASLYYTCPMETELCPPKRIESNDLQFLQSGTIPPNTNATILAYCNWSIYAWLNGLSAIYYNDSRPSITLSRTTVSGNLTLEKQIIGDPKLREDLLVPVARKKNGG